jgi:hypothetical protein
LLGAFALVAGPAQAKPRTDGSEPAPAHIARLVTHVPRSTLNAVGAGDVVGPKMFSVFKLGRHLMRDGKPELLAMDIAWCPHCAANNWAVAVALSRFGKLTGLRVIDAGTLYCKRTHESCNLRPGPCFLHTHGLSFFGTRFHSALLSLTSVVIEDVRGRRLQRLTKPEAAALQPFDPFGQAPELDIGGAYGFVNSGVDPGALAHKTWSQIATSLADPKNPIARRVDGLANLYTAAVCKVTNGRPSRVCTAKGVAAAGAARLDTAPPPPPPPPMGPGP